MINGQCVCGEVSFSIECKVLRFYSCHCSICRKATGSYGNAATMIDSSQFQWVTGEEAIHVFQKTSGFQSSFCKNCGSPLPKSLRNTDKYWVPIGLLDDTHSATLVAHIHLGSKASWDNSSLTDECLTFVDAPGIDAVCGLLDNS